MNKMSYTKMGFLSNGYFTFRQINTDNTNNYLARDNGAHQYNWVSPPNCTEPGFNGGITQTLHYLQPD